MTGPEGVAAIDLQAGLSFLSPPLPSSNPKTKKGHNAQELAGLHPAADGHRKAEARHELPTPAGGAAANPGHQDHRQCRRPWSGAAAVAAQPSARAKRQQRLLGHASHQAAAEDQPEVGDGADDTWRAAAAAPPWPPPNQVRRRAMPPWAPRHRRNGQPEVGKEAKPVEGGQIRPGGSRIRRGGGRIRPGSPRWSHGAA